ncbi:MAG: hypothetical protein H8E16_12125 [Flavobacteriales bacterium]|nr:hypothetical protein [Flavobacteriales bacterium]
MGQYAGQPDFGTFASDITTSDTISSATKLNSSALFIGSGGDVKVILAGVVGSSGSGLPTATEAVTFKNLSNGCFLPVIVDYVLATGTTAADIIAIK